MSTCMPSFALGILAKREGIIILADDGRRRDGFYGLTRKNAGGNRIKIMKNYLIVVEKTETGYSAYSPDILGCIAAGSSKDEVSRNIREAIEFHLEGLELEGLEIPEPQSYFEYY